MNDSSTVYTTGHEWIWHNSLNYRHSFHAGGIADVFKHLVLTKILGSLRAKDAPFRVIDTHAGSGLYKLEVPGEYQQGIGLLWPLRQQWPALADYLSVIEKFNNQGRLSRYPGSPLIISEFLRLQDHAVFFELHPQDYAALKLNLAGVKNAAVHRNNAWQTLKAFVPPPENRGLLLIDPPYEQPDDFDNVALALALSLRHWRNGIYMAWYPVKERRSIERLHSAIQGLASQAWAVEFTTLPTDVEQRLNGSGLILINPPWKLVDTLKQLLPILAQYFAAETGTPLVRFIDLSPVPAG
ncbi:MAG: 23S rRNA (adenine(2030)-N(6))-methyltransferase RlmJ [Gammaproteobacteria bacterium]